MRAALWDVTTRRKVLALETGSKVHLCEFSPDGNLLAARSTGSRGILARLARTELEADQGLGRSRRGITVDRTCSLRFVEGVTLGHGWTVVGLLPPFLAPLARCL